MNKKKRYSLKYILGSFLLFSFPSLEFHLKKILKTKKFSKVWIINKYDI